MIKDTASANTINPNADGDKITKSIFWRTLRFAFPLTVPVLTGFLFMGIAYGILMTTSGCSPIWTFLCSFMVFAGSMQYVALTLFSSAFHPLYAFALTLMVNARHIFYGLSMLDKLKYSGKWKPYIVFALCDESFSILSSTTPPPEVHRDLFYFFITFLNRWYWIIGSVVGAVLGNTITFNTKGLDFALTALFAVIFVENWMKKENRLSSAIGVICSVICLFFWKGRFIIPAMLLMLIVFALQSKFSAVQGEA